MSASSLCRVRIGFNWCRRILPNKVTLRHNITLLAKLYVLFHTHKLKKNITNISESKRAIRKNIYVGMKGIYLNINCQSSRNVVKNLINFETMAYMVGYIILYL